MRKIAAFIVLIIALSSSAYALDKNNFSTFKPKEITPDVAGKYAIYAMMASNAYHSSKKIHFDFQSLGWTQIDLKGKATNKPTKDHPITGLAYDIFENKTANEVVFAFRGTDKPYDYPLANLAIVMSPQYKQAKKEFGEYVKLNKNKKFYVTGHSLGGGIALSVSAKYGVPAYTFDSSPRIFDGLGDDHKQADRFVIYEKGEILDTARRHWSKIWKVVPEENVYVCKFNFPDGESTHKSDLLAKGLLELGAQSNKELTSVKISEPKKK